MKHISLTFMALFSISSFTQTIVPITSFTTGDYLGDGIWFQDNGQQGTFTNKTSFSDNVSFTIKYTEGSVTIEEKTLTIDANGFFTAQVINSTDPNNPIVYTGYGNCGSQQCQLTATLPNGVMNQTLLFDNANSTIYTLAAIYYNNGTPDIQWEETSALIPTDAAKRDYKTYYESNIARTSPITKFTPKIYIGTGAFLSDDATAGSYKQFLEMKVHGWRSAAFINGELYVANNYLTIDVNGFFTVEFVNFTNPTSPITYEGYGNCAVTQCQLTVALSNGTLQKALRIDPTSGDIYSFGAVYYNDGTPNVQWEENSIPIW